MAVLKEKWSSADSNQKASIKFTVYEIVGLFTGIVINIGLNYNDLTNFNSVIFMRMIKNVYLSKNEENCGIKEFIKA